MGDEQEQGNLQAVVLFSGGLDSTVLLHLFTVSNRYRTIVPLFFHYGSRHAAAEYKAAKNILKWYQMVPEEVVIPQVFKGPLVGDGPVGDTQSTVVPFRNGVMISIAAAWADSYNFDVIALAVHKTDNPYPDCRPHFLEQMKLAIYSGTSGHVRLLFPFAVMTKGTIVAEGDLMRVPMEKTWSCYTPAGSIHCGKCPACIERRKAFKEAHIYDPTTYDK